MLVFEHFITAALSACDQVIDEHSVWNIGHTSNVACNPLLKLKSIDQLLFVMKGNGAVRVTNTRPSVYLKVSS